ncbi:lysogeny maintenance protein PflM [Azomonas agilis]|uniref:lysogeny maintenance protein PflM n=1 Tax=Azomonas agilis TaxID=116849 RepID=UPI001479666E
MNNPVHTDGCDCSVCWAKGQPIQPLSRSNCLYCRPAKVSIFSVVIAPVNGVVRVVSSTCRIQLGFTCFEHRTPSRWEAFYSNQPGRYEPAS